MSKMATVPVIKCRGCGAAVYITHLSTARPDADAKQLRGLMQGLPSIALCRSCRNVYNYYAGQNRADEFFSHLFNPDIVLLSVHDYSGADYYKREDRPEYDRSRLSRGGIWLVK
jgi:hypothetical protein